MNVETVLVSQTKINSQIFPAKILLLGEYTIIKGSKGLAFPIHSYKASFSKAETIDDIQHSFRLDEFANYLTSSNILSTNMDLERLINDIKKGVFLNSNIPSGYGIGSSGALCAAIYASYAYDFQRKESYTNEELNVLKDIMALMENFYHGTSSGLDCLISLLNQPVLIEERNKYQLIDKLNLDALGQFFLFDSGISRSTAGFVHSFLEKYETDQDYKNAIDQHNQLIDHMTDNVLKSEEDSFKANFKKLSAFQFEHYADMIPENVKSVWKEGLNSGDYFFKLCGAGGGGFFLVYTSNNHLSVDTSYIPIN